MNIAKNILLQIVILLVTGSAQAVLLRSGSTKVQVVPAGSTPTVPYTLPQAGMAVAIGTNTASAIRTAGVSSLAWTYSLFDCYGTGTFAAGYSQIGAYVYAGIGGHNCPPVNVDAALFDFSDATWKLLKNSNGVTIRESDYSIPETTGSPYFEILSASSGQVPSPAHLTHTASYIPPSLGGGPKGSYLRMGGYAATVSAYTASGIHKLDLATGKWSRVTPDTLSYSYAAVASTMFDSLTNRFYFVHDAFHNDNSFQYLDSADWKVKRSTSYPYPAAKQGSGYQSTVFDPVRRILIAHRSGFAPRALDLNNISQGWIDLKTAGTQPSTAETRWAFYEPDGTFYTRGNSTGQVLSRFIPPSGDWKTNAWTYSSVTIGGASMSNYTTTGGTTPHYGSLFYVPAIKSLAWIAGESAQVILLKPPL